MIKRVGAVGPKVSLVCFALAGSELLYRRFICMEHRSRQEQRFQSIPKRGEVESCATHPIAQGRLRERDAAPGCNLFNAVEREVIAKLADQNPGQKTRGRHTAFDQSWSNGSSGDRLAMPAGILGTDVSVNREFGRLDTQLISDIFADLNLLLATASTGAGRKVMPVFNDGH